MANRSPPSLGRYGPYIKHGNNFRSLAPDDDVLTVGINRAVSLLAEPRQARGRAQRESLRDLRVIADGKIMLYKGRYGNYVSRDGVNATLPRDIHGGRTDRRPGRQSPWRNARRRAAAASVAPAARRGARPPPKAKAREKIRPKAQRKKTRRSRRLDFRARALRAWLRQEEDAGYVSSTARMGVRENALPLLLGSHAPRPKRRADPPCQRLPDSHATRDVCSITSRSSSIPLATARSDACLRGAAEPARQRSKRLIARHRARGPRSRAVRNASVGRPPRPCPRSA